MMAKIWKYPLVKLCSAGLVGYIGFGVVDSVDSSSLLDDNQKWREYRSDFYEYYFKFAEVIGIRHYIEEDYRENIPSGSYLRCAIDSLEKAHHIISFDSDDRIRRRVLRKAHRYMIKAINDEDDVDLRAEAHKWYGIIMLKRSKYGNQEKRLLKAVNELEKALVVDSIDPKVWYYLGIAKNKLGEHQQAVDCHLRSRKLKLFSSNNNLKHDIIDRSNFEEDECPQNDYHLGLAQKKLESPDSRKESCNAFQKALTKHCNSVADITVFI
ncbi:unnamed protein product [Thelazia callipaeda]|uniref:TPR_REGION domain-containing protein n=1 Tax=Thelazia callipaeda TaxID=103827 RepID=A0A0N5D6K7_THECL|nr:unnamed protein product [Thelazia callipaeda]